MTSLQPRWPTGRPGSFAGPGKRPAEIDEAVASGIGHLVVEGLHQAQIASEAALRRGVVQRVLARISPASSPKGFGARMTGVATRFGIDEEDAAEVLAEVAGLPGWCWTACISMPGRTRWTRRRSGPTCATVPNWRTGWWRHWGGCRGG